MVRENILKFTFCDPGSNIIWVFTINTYMHNLFFKKRNKHLHCYGSSLVVDSRIILEKKVSAKSISFFIFI